MSSQVPSPRETSPVRDGEFAFSWAEFREIAALVHSRAGIVLGDNKVNLVYSRLAKRLRALGLQNFRDYCALIRSTEGVDEQQKMIAAITTNVTRFFREPHHFDHFRERLVPRLERELDRAGRVRIWSAGCSSGEEPYSIAMTLLDALPDAVSRDVLVLATDIDTNMLERGENGRYDAAQAESIPLPLRKKWLVPERSGATMGFRVSDSVRALVRFRELNLLSAWPMKGQFDAIFCRNVLIYFDEPTQKNIWARFATLMKPGGTLYIGHSERIPPDGLPFELCGQTTYALLPGGSA